MVRVTRVAGVAGVREGVGRQLVEVLLDQAVAGLGNVDVLGELLHGGDGGIRGLGVGHTRGIHAHEVGGTGVHAEVVPVRDLLVQHARDERARRGHHPTSELGAHRHVAHE